MDDHGSPEWHGVFRRIVDGWLFSDATENLPPVVVLPLENPDLHDATVWDEQVEIERRYRSISVVRKDGFRFGMLTPKLGAPAAAMVVEAAAARGVRVVIGVGFCGAIAPELDSGDVLIPTAAMASDGTSIAYGSQRSPVFADHQLVAAVHRIGGSRVRDGLVRSFDAVCTQDSVFIESCRELGVSAIDMETSAVLTVARLRTVRAVTVLVVSDHPGQGKPSDGLRVDEGARWASELVLELVVDHLRQLD